MTFVAPARRSGAVVRDPRPATGRPLETEYRPRHPLDLRRTVLYQRRGAGDPTMAVSGAVIWRVSRTPAGVATLAIRETHPGVIRGAAWGPGSEWALAQLPAQSEQLVADEDHEPGGQAHAEVEQQLVVAREQRRVRRSLRHQVHQRRAGDHAEEDQGLHGVIVQRCQSESSVQSREEIAFSWNGFGSWAVSRRMRTAAS